MAKIADALAWMGSGAMLSMYTISKSSSVLDAASLSLEPAPIRASSFMLDDENSYLPGRYVVVYDLLYPDIPPSLNAVLTRCLNVARASGADVAWFGFEGSFHFDWILTAGIANQIYAVMDADGIAIASDTTLGSKEWEDRIVRAGMQARES